MLFVRPAHTCNLKSGWFMAGNLINLSVHETLKFEKLACATVNDIHSLGCHNAWPISATPNVLEPTTCTSTPEHVVKQQSCSHQATSHCPRVYTRASYWLQIQHGQRQTDFCGRQSDTRNMGGGPDLQAGHVL